MEIETPEGRAPDLDTDRAQSRCRMRREVFYFSCATVAFAALLVAVVSAPAPPPDNARIVVTDEIGNRTVSQDTVKALRQACAAERIETPTWHWSPRWSGTSAVDALQYATAASTSKILDRAYRLPSKPKIATTVENAPVLEPDE